jgi:hypothetical protein
MDIIDKALTERIGGLDASTAAAIREEATAAFLYGLSQATALDLARGLHWLAQGHPLMCSSEYILGALSVADLSAPRHEEITRLLDVSYTLSYERQSTQIPLTRSQPALWLDASMLGWRLVLALELLSYDEIVSGSS